MKRSNATGFISGGLCSSGRARKSSRTGICITAGSMHTAWSANYGSTLIFNGCEEVHPPLADLCIDLGQRFHHPVAVNLYAGWRRDNGFNVHWDDHNAIILQVSGGKQWKMWWPTRLYPLRDHPVDTAPEPPSGEPDIPVEAEPRHRAEWLAELRAELLAVWDGNPIDRYLAEMDSKAVEPPRISLPGDVDLHRKPLRKTTPLYRERDEMADGRGCGRSDA